MKIAFTVCNRYQLPHALVLGESLRSHHPEFHFIIGWTDSARVADLPAWVKLVHVHELDIPEWQEMADRYYDFELVAACKPFFARHILNMHRDCSQLAYFSPTTWVLGSLKPVLNPEVFLQLTPLRLTPLPTGNRLDDKAILNIGMYHAGSWVLHPDGQEGRLFDWWCLRTADRAHFDLCQGMCLDQLWMNYLPALFLGTRTIRNSGWHYGLHAVPDHGLTQIAGEKFEVGGQPLLTVDLTGIEGYHPVWTDHAGLIRQRESWPALLDRYRARLAGQNIPDFAPHSAPFGKKSVVKPYRRQRKRAVEFLKKVINQIETYDLTHP